MTSSAAYNLYAVVTYNFGDFILGFFLVFCASLIHTPRTRDRIILASTIPSALQIYIAAYWGAGQALVIYVILAIFQLSWAKHLLASPSGQSEDPAE